MLHEVLVPTFGTDLKVLLIGIYILKLGLGDPKAAPKSAESGVPLFCALENSNYVKCPGQTGLLFSNPSLLPEFSFDYTVLSVPG